MIRSIICLLFLALFLILTLPVMLIFRLIGIRKPLTMARASRALIAWAFRCTVFLAGTKVIVTGQENIPADSAALYIANHRSYFDILLTFPLLPAITGYVSKKEMRKLPIVPWWMKMLHCHFLDRKNIKEGLKTILAAIEDVKNGVSICIFPEGTRNKVNDTFLPFHDGSFKIADKGNVPVVPITILNAAAILENHFPKVKKATVVIDFGKPVSISDLDRETKKRIGAYFSEIIEKRYFELKEEYKL
jgi:1-acyl-sn-glycerol-3-phosphate acyltransferase